MPLSASFTVTGLDEVQSNLNDLATKATQFMNSEPMKIAEEMVQKMQAIAPVDTGYLRDNITAEEDGEGKATVRSGADYSIYVELGHRTRGGRGYVQPQPFFFPVIDEYSIQNLINDWNVQVGVG